MGGFLAPSFEHGNVTTVSFFNFVKWADASFDDSCDDPLQLPAMQRRVLWTPGNVLEFWDSLLRGMPTGMFYLIPSTGVGRNLAGETREGNRNGYDLLDGQQRTRTMLLAVRTPEKEERCLWIDLGVSLASGAALRLTTKSQPFGYDSKGGKLELRERLQARSNLGQDEQSVYSHELYQRSIDNSHRPPTPAKIEGPAIPMQELISLWHDTGRNRQDFDLAVRNLVDAEIDVSTNLDALCNAFGALDVAQIALVRVEPPAFADGTDWLLRLFVRIGSGGVPLSPAEQLYSIYKFHEPYVHKTVSAIEGDPAVGHVMPPTAIVETALRIANAQKPKEAFGVPDTGLFGRELANRGSPFEAELHKLLPLSDRAPGEGGDLIAAFRTAFRFLVYDKDINPDGLPKALLVRLRPELIQVLVYWAILATPTSGSAASVSATRREFTQFSLFWQLCVLPSKHERGVQRAFRLLKGLYSNDSRTEENIAFPGKQLYLALSTDGDGGPCARKLMPFNVIKTYAFFDPSAQWRSREERFRSEVLGLTAIESEAAKALYRVWWESDQMLLWLQRSYLSTEFGGYDPSSDRDEDKPYDLDHIQPQANWNFHGSTKILAKVEGDGTGDYYTSDFYNGRHDLGNSVGNKRWIDSSENRSWGKTNPNKKLKLDRFLAQDAQPDKWMTSTFDVRESSVRTWLDAGADDGDGVLWTSCRKRAFQQAVEERALWLYERFWEDNGFSTWMGEEKL